MARNGGGVVTRPGKPTATLNGLVGCDLPTRDGRRCNKPGHPDLPEGICLEHAIAVYRAMSRMITDTRSVS